MKVYYLRLTQDDFDDREGNVWTTSSTIDLYDNDWYRNYSTVKSDYGSNLLGNKTWTGLTTDDGFVDDDRYIDLTGRIDITSKRFTISDYAGTGEVTHTLNVYTTDIDDADFPENWASLSDIEDNRPIFWVNAFRYAKFQLNLNAATDQDIDDAVVELFVRIEIDEPVIAPLYRRTKAVLNRFPEWMSMREVDAADDAGATPTSVGGQLINAVAGEWLDDLDKTVEYVRLQRYISTADTNQVAWVYYSANVPDYIYAVEGDDVELSRSASLEEFYEADDDADIMWWDEARKILYTRKEYDFLEINGDIYDQEPQHVWNWFDEHGAIVDLTRHHAEDNQTFKQRILDVYINTPGVSLDAFKLALRRELNLWLSFDSGATPDSYALGATPTVLEIADLEDMSEFMDPDGMPTQRFISLVDQLAEQYPTTWGYFRWNRAIWDIGGEEDKGYSVLPYRYDATPVPDEYTQSGVGDGADLYVYRPDVITGPREFEYRLKVRGRERNTRLEYPYIIANVEIRGRADKEIYDNPVQTPWFTVAVEVGPDTFYLPVQATVVSDVDNDTPTPTSNSHYTYQLVGPDGQSLLDQQWYYDDGTPVELDFATPFYIDFENADDITVQWGRFDPDTQTFTDYPDDGSVTLWFAEDDATTLVANDDDTTLTPDDFALVHYIVIQSNEVESAVGKWESEAIPFHGLLINGMLPGNQEREYIVEPPEILWDPNLEAVPNKELVIEVVTFDPEGNRIVYSQDLQGNHLNLDYTILEVNGDNSWVDGELVLPYDGDLLNFTAGTSVDPEYPITASEWTLFEAVEEDTSEGVVDEVGPWRNGSPQEPGNANYILEQRDVTRDDFGISNSEDIVITWMGVDIITDARVNVWLDTNTVNPATDDDDEVVYPDNAIIEEYDDDIDNYIFSPFHVKARAITEIQPQWYPQVHSGWFYERAKEYYFYAEPVTEQATATDWVLADVARQGAPIIVKTDEATPVEYRQVAFFDEATPVLRLENVEIVQGTGEDSLYVAYEDVFDISIVDLTIGLAVSADTFTTTNKITTDDPTDKTHDYEITYTVNNSFIADHEYIEDGDNRTSIEIAERVPFGGDFTITYEGSDYDPATPVPLPLNTFYTTLDEGFIFLSHSEYDLFAVEVRLSPARMIADGYDYILISLRSFDDNYNPKPDQTFELTASFGLFENETGVIEVTTDDDGFATAILYSEVGTASMDATLEIDGPGIVDAEVTYRVEPVKAKEHRLVAMPSTDQMPADNGESQVVVFGKVEDGDYEPVPYANVAWRRGRSVEAMFSTSFMGQVVADENGVFTIGPFESADQATPGYWFLAAESWDLGASPSGVVATPDYGDYATPSYGPVGDVVFWNEYPDAKFGVNDTNELPKAPMQMQVNPNDQVYYSYQNAFPVTYDDTDPLDEATPVVFEYESPKWYAIDRYTQYQLGLLGTGFYSVDLASLNDAPPDHKDV